MISHPAIGTPFNPYTVARVGVRRGRYIFGARVVTPWFGREKPYREIEGVFDSGGRNKNGHKYWESAHVVLMLPGSSSYRNIEGVALPTNDAAYKAKEEIEKLMAEFFAKTNCRLPELA